MLARRDVTRLESQPPTNLNEVRATLVETLRQVEIKLEVRTTLVNTLRQVEIKLERVERVYYQQEFNEGHDKTSPISNLELEELTRCASAIRPMLSFAGLFVFVSLDQVNNAIYQREITAEVIKMMRPSQNQHQRLPAGTPSMIKAVPSSLSSCNLTADTPTSHRAASGYSNHEEALAEAAGSSVSASRISGHVQNDEIDTDDDDDKLFTVSKMMRKCVDKVLEAVPSCFDDIIAEINRLQRHLAKYCVSFLREVTSDVEIPTDHGHKHQQLVRSSTTRSALLATAITYDRQIKLHQLAINAHLSSVRDLAQRFRQTELRLIDIGPDGFDLARRTGAAHAPFLLLFPISCRRIRAAIEEMRAWLVSDASYEGSISSDIDGLEVRVKSLDERLRASREEFHRGLFWAQSVRQQCMRLDGELKGIKGKEDGLIVDEEMLLAEIKQLKVEISEITYKRSEVAQSALLYANGTLREKLNELDNHRRSVHSALRVTEAALKDIRQKITRIKEINQLMKSERKRLTTLERGRDEMADVIAELEVERDTSATALGSLRQILTLKRSPDVIKKLFRDRPAHVTNVQRLPGNGAGNDNFDRMCRLVASTISTDWPALYRNLPFVPARGTATVDQDIAEITSSRGLSSALAEKALFRWRRYHTLACPEDLVSSIRRTTRDFELVRRIETKKQLNK